MNITRRQLRRLIREAVKQYAVGPDQFFTQSPLDPQYEKLKALAKTDSEMATELGYTPEIIGDEIVFSGEPIMDWIVDNYLNQPEKRDHIGIQHTIIDLYVTGKEVLMRPRPGDPFGKEFLQFEQGLIHPIMDMYKSNKDMPPEQIIKKMAPIIAKHKKEQPEQYYNNLVAIFRIDPEDSTTS